MIKEKDMAKLVFCGDFFYDYPYFAQDIKQISDYIRQEDLMLILNLEAPLADSSCPIKKRGPNLSQSEISVEVLKKLNVVGVCLANNHIMDYGPEALARTLKLLDTNGIRHTGAGMDLGQARVPMEFETGEERVAILNYGWDVEEVLIAGENTPGAVPRDFRMIQEDISKSVRDGKKVIVNMHWGFEYNLMPQPYDISLAHDMVKAGAGLIIGHHPHVIQSYEKYEGAAIYYSVGNFYFSSRRMNYNKVFKTENPRECDYGLMIVLNAATMETAPLTIHYDKDLDQSQLTEKDYPIENISGMTAGKGYIKRVRLSKKHVNPVLTDNRFLNKVKLWYLKFVVRKVLRKLWLVKESLCGNKR